MTFAAFIRDRRLHLVLFLWLIAAHSFCVGFGMIFFPIDFINSFGFSNDKWHFFLVQGGVFHFVMSIAYFYGVKQIDYSSDFIIFAVIVKMIATLFLFIYYFLIADLLIILLSGIGDGLMAMILYTLFYRFSTDFQR